MKRVFPFLECGMCGRANDNMCDDCRTCLEDTCSVADAPDERIFVGSGEDGNLYANYNKDFLREYA